MDSLAYRTYTSATSDMAKVLMQGQVDVLDICADAAKGTLAAPFLSAMLQMQRSALENMTFFEGFLEDPRTKTGTAADAQYSKPSDDSPLFEAARSEQSVTAIPDETEGFVSEDVANTEDNCAAEDLTGTEDLTVVNGIGPSTMKKLHSEGVKTLADLAAMSPQALADILHAAKVRSLKYAPEDWIAEAKVLLKAA